VSERESEREREREREREMTQQRWSDKGEEMRMRDRCLREPAERKRAS